MKYTVIIKKAFTDETYKVNHCKTKKEMLAMVVEYTDMMYRVEVMTWACWYNNYNK